LNGQLCARSLQGLCFFGCGCGALCLGTGMIY